MEQLAEASGVSARAISDVERGYSRAPQARTLAALADGLGLSEDDGAALLAAARQARSPGTGGRPRSGELPRGVSDFIGRGAELAMAREVAHRVGHGQAPVLVVHGQAGLGKTAFAVRVADDLRDDFPDGRFHLDLRGVDPAPLRVGEALRRLLRALDVHPSAIAGDDDERSAQLRAVLGERRCLLVFDNAGSEAQVRPLLPGDSPSLVVVTSRRALGGLEGVVRIELPTLAATESADLIRAIAAQAADPAAADAVASVSDLCGHLPLALRIAGTRLASRPQWTVPDMVDRLKDAERRLAALSAGDSGVASSFALSHAQLSSADAMMFRRLTHIPGPNFAPPLAAILTGTGPAEAEDRLEELVELGMLHPDGADRYRFHDLIRLYAADRLRAEETPAERAATERRMTDWLLKTAIVAGGWFEPERGELPDDWTDSVSLTSVERAGAWLRAETDNWLPAVHAAAADGRHQLVVDLADATYWYSNANDRWPGWYEVRKLADAAAAALPDQHQQARHRRHYAYTVAHIMGRPEAGADIAMEAYRLAEKVADLGEQSAALAVLQQAWQHLDRFDEAEWANRTAQELADRAGEHDQFVSCVFGLGYLLEMAGRHDEAIAQHRRALVEVERRPVSAQMRPYTEGHAWYGIAASQCSAGRWSESLLAADRALPMLIELDNAHMLAYLFIARGRAHAGLRHLAEARADLTHGIELFEGTPSAGAATNRQVVLARQTLAELDAAGEQ